MMKRWLTLLFLGLTLTTVLIACGSTGSGSNGSNSPNQSGPNQVHMDNNTFVQSTITIKKGESITLIADTFSPHVIANGSWENGSAKGAQEPGAPAIKAVQVGGNSSATVGPFTTAGTFKLYCTVHQGMNLTVTVQ